MRLSIFLSVCLTTFLGIPALYSQDPTPLPLMPVPLHLTQGQGQLKIDGTFTIGLNGYKDARLESARKRFLNTLSHQTGIPLHDEEASWQGDAVGKNSGR